MMINPSRTKYNQKRFAKLDALREKEELKIKVNLARRRQEFNTIRPVLVKALSYSQMVSIIQNSFEMPELCMRIISYLIERMRPDTGEVSVNFSELSRGMTQLRPNIVSVINALVDAGFLRVIQRYNLSGIFQFPPSIIKSISELPCL